MNWQHCHPKLDLTLVMWCVCFVYKIWGALCPVCNTSQLSLGAGQCQWGGHFQWLLILLFCYMLHTGQSAPHYKTGKSYFLSHYFLKNFHLQLSKYHARYFIKKLTFHLRFWDMINQNRRWSDQWFIRPRVIWVARAWQISCLTSHHMTTNNS